MPLLLGVGGSNIRLDALQHKYLPSHDHHNQPLPYTSESSHRVFFVCVQSGGSIFLKQKSQIKQNRTTPTRAFLFVPLPFWFISSHKVFVTSIPVPFATALGSCLERLLTPRVGFRRPASKSVGPPKGGTACKTLQVTPRDKKDGARHPCIGFL